MKLLQVTVLCLLSSLCSSDDNIDAGTATTPVLNSSTISAAKTTVPTLSATVKSLNFFEKSTVGTSPKGTINNQSSQTSPLPTLLSLSTTVKSEEATTNVSTKKVLTTPSTTVTNLTLPNAVSTLQSSQHKTENQSSVNATKISGSTPQPDTSPSKPRIVPSVSTTIPENISLSQGTENAKNASPSTNPSRSSIILPVVIALIVITLSVFALVGLYRLCRKTDPGTPENGNDQPQSDKESVKLLTVKTISHESGERSAQGKNKN
ncbi:PREDICTED: endomucin isoform X2 [Miniopterus natalensis]|uniref:endomucin isoform X2 n=1 Tax=Miniopterus natalensis TaxID=291302 RepID=UPI0007A6C9A1|nr:PREDICTED: endomucin isoform X2 [Miniopterus natalensis]